MEIKDNILFDSEKIIFSLRQLFMDNGYKPFKVKKFEEYSLYTKLDDILQLKNVITFVDTNGQTLALKPDITLSVVKYHDDNKDQKICYSEHVYRVFKGTERYGESSQIGIENLGNIKLEDVAEVINLSYLSLSTVSDDYILMISNLDVLQWLVENITKEKTLKQQIYKYVVDKNVSDLNKFCTANNFNKKDFDSLIKLCFCQLTFQQVISFLNKIDCPKKYINNIEEIKNCLQNYGICDSVKFDFSISDNISFYNSFVFKGYVKGIPTPVVCGGQYDNLMKALNKQSKGVGLAVYLDFIEYYGK